MSNLKKLKISSVYKILLLVILCFYFQNPIILLGAFLFIALNDRRNIIIFVLLFGLLILINQFKSDFISYGIVDYKSGRYYIVDKLLYKVKTESSTELQSGDIVHFKDKGTDNDVSTQLSRNIIYICNNPEKISSFELREYFYSCIDNLDDSLRPYLKKFIYNITDYENTQYVIGYGLMAYYFFGYLYRKNRYIGFVSVMVFSLLFSFQVKFFLIIILFILDFMEADYIDKYFMRIYLLVLINKNFISNYSILIPCIIGLFNLFRSKLSFRNFFFILNISLFHEINLISSLMYPLFIKFQIVLFGFTMAFLVCPFIKPLYSILLNIYSLYCSLNISIRGRLGILSLIFMYFAYRKYEFRDIYVSLLIILLCVCPLNDIFFHVTYIDVGQGNATLIRNILHGKTVLIDTGSSYNYLKLKSYLFSESVYKIDYLVITHMDSDHSGNIENLQKDFKIDNIIYDKQDIICDRIHLKNYDIGIYDNDNDNSLVYSMNVDSYDFLFTGDISSDVEMGFINKFGPFKCDFYQASHHGSYTGNSDYMIRNILPRYAIISTSGMYNHPAAETIQTFDNYKVKYFITRDTGNVRIDISRYYDLITLSKKGFVIIKGK